MTRAANALGLAMALAVGPCCAAQQKLAEISRTHAMGGTSYRLRLSPNQRHAVSAGNRGGLVIWDLQEHCPSHHIAAAGVSALAMHPSAATAFVSWQEPGGDRGVFELNLETGAATKLLPMTANVLGVDEDGEHLATAIVEEKRQRFATYRLADLRAKEIGPIAEQGWHPHGFAYPDYLTIRTDGTVTSGRSRVFGVPWRSSRSADGSITVARDKSGAVIVGERNYGFRLARTINQLVVSNGGALLAIDDRGQCLMQAAAGRRVFAPHRGEADRMVFSPDGTHLAIMSLGAVRIVDLAGNDKLLLAGTHIVTPGKDGAEFWLASDKSAWRWNAATRSRVGQPIVWAGKDVALVRQTFRPFHAPFGRRPPFRFERLGCITFLDKQVWLQCGREWGQRWFVRQTENRWIEERSYLTRVSVKPLPGGEDNLVLSMRRVFRLDSCYPEIFMQRFSKDGERLASWRGNGVAIWSAVNDAGTKAWVGSEYSLRGVGLERLETTVKHEDPPPWIDAIAWHDDTLLVTDGKQVEVVDPMTLTRERQLSLPEDLAKVDLIAASPDRSHLAIATGTEVRILRLQ